jgi:hypothetical protein
MPSAWPNSTEVTTRLGVYGLTLPTGFTAQNAIDEAVALWHELVGYSPFLAGSSATYTVDPCESELIHLPAPFGEITAVTVDDVEQTIGEDVFLMPRVLSGDPYKFLQFNAVMVGDPGSISVTGKLGWLAIPSAVWNAIIDLACGIVQRKSGNVTGDVQRIKQESVEIQFRGGGNDSSSLFDKTYADVRTLAMRYRI